MLCVFLISVFFFQAEDGIRDSSVTGVQTCALPIWFQRVFSYFPGIQYTVHQVIVQGWPWNTLVATRLSVAAPRADGSVYQNDVMQFLRLRWGKVVEDHLYEDTYKLVNELQQRLSREEIDGTERQTFMQESVSVLRETSKGGIVR